MVHTRPLRQDPVSRVSSNWILLPAELLLGRGAPIVAAVEHACELAQRLAGNEVRIVDIDLSAVPDEIELFLRLKGELPFPEWCGNNWDSVFDAFEELKSGWTFPLAFLIRGLERFIGVQPAVALRAVISLAQLSDGLGSDGKQLVVVYVMGSSRPNEVPESELERVL